MMLEVLPTRSGGAAENMALDFLLLQRYPKPDTPRFRHYGWHGPAFTFGYSQKIIFVRNTLPADEDFELCRRATGGGVVDHRDDWTFSLVLPRGHPLEDVRATQSYREVHECLAAALQRQSVHAVTKQAPDPLAASGFTGPGVCFQRAEIYDVVHAVTGEKIAGAAQKRNKHGLLFQGSVWRPSLGVTLDAEKLHHDFTTLLGNALAAPARLTAWPDLNEDEVTALTEQYASTEWNEAR
jgi:lipoate-protein ligase A